MAKLGRLILVVFMMYFPLVDLDVLSSGAVTSIDCFFRRLSRNFMVTSKIHGAVTNRAKHFVPCLMLPVIVLERLGWLECSESNS
jgi:hypothetical protein